MAHLNSGTTDFAHGQPIESSPLTQSNLQNHEGSSTIGDGDLNRTNSTASQSHTLTPSKGGTLKKKQSVSRRVSLKRSNSRKSSRPGSVRSLNFADDAGTQSAEMNNAFYTPVPTTGSPTEILANRFQVWRKVLKDLITYFRDVQKSYDARAKSLYTLSNVIGNIPTPPQFMSEGGISDALQVLREYHKQSITEANKAKSIEEDVILQLTGLRSDLSQKIKEIKSLSGDFKNSVDKETEGTRRAVRELQDSLATAGSDPKSDPYLVRLAVDRQVSRQLEEENYLHRAFLNLESSGRELESIVMGEIQKAYNAYGGVLKREGDEAYEAVERLRGGPLALPKDSEWNAFVSNNDNFVDPKLPVRKVEYITYPGKDDPAATEVRAGMLERKSKYLKSYTPGWYVLSTTHLHEFKSPDRIASQTPVMSLPLADQKLGSHSGTDSASHKFMLKGRQSGGLHRGHAWVFRAESYDTMLAWFSDIKNLTEKTGEERSAFIRRTHARSVSGGSQKAASVSSDDRALDEDEADQVPYSAAASQAGIEPAQEEKLPQRPKPGGRFPSALNINRDSQVPLSPSSPSSSGDRDIIAAAGALPGSGLPFGGSGQPVKAGEDEVDTSNGNPPDVGAGASTAPEIHPPFMQQFTRHDSKYGEWMAPVAAGAGGAAFVAAGAGAVIQERRREQAQHDVQPELQAAEIPPQQQPQQTTSTSPVQAGVAVPSDTADTADTVPTSVNNILSASVDHIADPAAPIKNLAHVSDPGEPIKELAKRPTFESHTSVVTISDLHVPGEFAKE